MAYMNQDMKKKLSPQINAVLKKYGVKGSIAVRNHSTLVVNLREGTLDLVGCWERMTGNEAPTGYIQVNHYYLEQQFEGLPLTFMQELLDAMNGKGSEVHNYDNSDIMTDYFDVGWYIQVNVGRYGKPYIYRSTSATAEV